MNEVAFEVGGTYENEKGVYEVVSIDENQNEMVIKWKDGKEFTTSIGLQWRILERRRIEREMAASKNGPKSRKSRAMGARFQGFLENDFSGGVAGTTWRTQKSLGGAVTALLSMNDPQLKSRAVSRMPEVHWEYVNRGVSKNKKPAKLFVKLDKEFLHYGFYVERAKDSSKGDWANLISWLGDTKNESWLKEIADEFQLRIYNKKGKVKPFDGPIKAAKEQWKISNGAGNQSIESLAVFLEQLPDKHAVSLYIAKETDKKDSLARGAKIAGDIAALFDILMPMYRASVSPTVS
jgi:hypothetical protein